MHYKTEVNAGGPIGTVDAFLADARGTRQAGHAVKVEKGKGPKEPEVWVMSWR